jgi:hypothetical protein
MIQGMGEDGGLDLFGDPVGMRASGAGPSVDQPFGAAGAGSSF